MVHEQRFYREPLLLVLASRGGSAGRVEALAAMDEMLADLLTDADRVPLNNRGSEEGWRNRTSWEVKDLKNEGILLPTASAGTGNWTLSDRGRRVADDVARETPAGTNYKQPPTPSPLNRAEPFDVDPDLVDRGRVAHHKTVDALARWVRARGLRPLLPTTSTPQYDLAWRDGDTLNVAEVKSITDTNQERQLRLGLGQVLRYRHLLAAKDSEVVAWLVPERAPADETWAALCDDIGVVLAYPPMFASLAQA